MVQDIRTAWPALQSCLQTLDAKETVVNAVVGKQTKYRATVVRDTGQVVVLGTPQESPEAAIGSFKVFSVCAPCLTVCQIYETQLPGSDGCMASGGLCMRLGALEECMLKVLSVL